MVKFGTNDLKEAMALGEDHLRTSLCIILLLCSQGAQAAAEVSKEFIKPIKLEFEKVGISFPICCVAQFIMLRSTTLTC
jgi:hypothetical protein